MLSAGCGHCKNLAPTYEELAGVYAKVSDVVIANVDADAHKSLGGRFGVQGFPTIKFFPRGSTTPEEYVCRCFFCVLSARVQRT